MSQYERDLADYSRRQRNPLLQGLAGCGIRPESGTFPDYVLAEAAQLFSPDRWRQPNIGTIFSYTNIRIDLAHSWEEVHNFRQHIHKVAISSELELEQHVGSHICMPAETLPAGYYHHCIVYDVQIDESGVVKLEHIGFGCNGFQFSNSIVTEFIERGELSLVLYEPPLHPRKPLSALLLALALIGKPLPPYTIHDCNCEVIMNKIFINSDRTSLQVLDSPLASWMPPGLGSVGSCPLASSK